MLQLLLERGQSYEDIGSLLGLGVEEVRARARAALTEMGGEDPDREVGMTDYLLGQADPIGRADAARHLQSDAESRELAGKLVDQLRLLAPNADLPSLPAARAARAASKASPAAASAPAASTPGRAALSGPQRRLIAALLGGGALVAVVVLLATGVFSGDDEAEEGGSATSEQRTATDADEGAGELTRAVLRPLGGSEAQGVALFGRVRNVPVLEVRAEGLEPSTAADSYSFWLYRNERVALRVGAVKVTESGRIVAQIPVPAQALGFVANGTFDSIVVSNTRTAEFGAEVERAREQRRLPRFTGEPVLRGEITGPAVQQAGRGGGAQGG